MKIEKAIIKVGDSFAVIIPSEIANQLDIKVGDIFSLDYDRVEKFKQITMTSKPDHMLKNVGE